MLNFTIALLLLAVVIIVLSIVPAFVGTLVLYHTLVRSKKAPADTSNRIGHLRLVWFALTREDMFADLWRRKSATVGCDTFAKAFPWLQMDEAEAVSHDHDGR